MKKTITLFTLLAFTCFAARAAFTPVAVTGFNEDVVANGTNPMTSVSPNLNTIYDGMDAGGDVLVGPDYVDFYNGVPQYHLPVGGLLTSAITSGLTFQLADYTANNDLLLANPGDAGTLTFTTAQSASTVYLSGFSAGYAQAEFDVQVNFSDGSSQTFSNNIFDDWMSTTYAASYSGIGEVYIGGGLGFGLTAQYPRTYELALNIDPANVTKNITGITITKTQPTADYTGYLSIMAVSVNTTSCSGAPTAGTVAASQSQGCVNQVFNTTLTLSGSDNSGGITYQWQSSTDGTTWTNVDGATTNNYVTTVFAPIYYRDSLTCINGNGASETPGLQFTFISPVPVPATLPYFQGFENWIGTCYLHDRPDNAWILDPVTGNASWRRNDEGTDANWDYADQDGPYTPTSTEGSYSARFHATDANQQNGSMYLYADFSAAGTKSITFDYINIDNNQNDQDQLVVSVSSDSGTTWTVIGTVGNQKINWTKETFITDAVSPHAIIQFQGQGIYPYGDMGIDSVYVSMLPACSGTPDAGTITASQTSGCFEYTSDLGSTSALTTGGYTYQWASSTDGTTFAPLTNATDNTYTADVTATVYYELTITCPASEQSVTTTPIMLPIATPLAHYATLPYFQGFESWIGTCFNYDRPDSNWTQWPVFGNSSWRRDDQGTDATWFFLTDGVYSPASTESAHSARFHTSDAPEGQPGDLYLYADFSATGTKQILFDYINVGQYDESTFTVSISTDSGTTWSTLGSYVSGVTSWTPEVLTTDVTAPHVMIQFEGNSNFDFGDMGIDSVYVSVLPDCNGTPVAGTTNTTQISACEEFFPTLSLNMDNTVGGMTYQWYQSSDGITYTSINGATNPTYQPDVQQSTYFYCKVTCTSSTQTDNSTAIEELVTTPTPVYASLPYFQGFENWIGTCYTYDRPDNSWTNIVSYGDNSWRRDDQGSDAGWNDPTYGMATPAFTEGSHSARCHVADFGFEPSELDLYVNLGSTGTKTISFDYVNMDQQGSTFSVGISTDGGNTWTQLATYGDNVTSWESKTVSTNATGNAIIQFVTNSQYGSGDIGLDSVNVVVAPSCAGLPAAGTFSNTQAQGCVPFLDTMTVDDPVYASGIVYQWQNSPDGNTWTNVSGATDLTYGMSTQLSANSYYRYRVVCTTGNDTAYSTATELLYTPEVVTTATLPYFQGFENWVGGACYAYDRPDSSWIETPNVGNNSIRKYNQGPDAQWDFIPNGTYFPISTEGNSSARFHQTEAAGQPGIMDLHVDLSPAGTKQITFDAINSSSNDFNVSLSEDGGNNFTSLGSATQNNQWTQQAFTTNSVAANAIIRIIINPGGGFFNPDDVGMDSFYIHVLPSCDGTPVAGTFTATQTTGCVAYVSDLSVDAPIVLSNISYQWQSSTDNVTWGDVGGATSTTYEADVNATVYYRFIVTCSASGTADTSAATELALIPEVSYVANLPYFQGFESWSGTCTPVDRPDSNWSQEYTSGNQAWARDDQQDIAGWDNPFNGSYFPPSTQGDHSASFDSYDDGGAYGDDDGGSLMLHINLSPAGTKTLTFDYINDYGDDFLNVDLSEDGGNNWTTLTTLNSSDYTGVTGWVSESVTTNSVSPTAIIRFNAFGDFDEYDMGIDSLYITAPTCDTLSNVAVSGITNTNAIGTWDAMTGTAGYEAVINATAGDPSTAPGTSANSYVANTLTPGTTYYLHVRDSCGPGLYSAWTTVTFTTTGNSGCDTISNLSVNNITQSGATINWNVVMGTAGYEYAIGTTSVPPSAGTGTNTNSATLNNLTPNTFYYVFVRDSCGPNNFSAWDTITFTITLGVPSINGNFNVDAYPNPAKDIVTVRAYGQKGANRKVSLTDVAGRVIEEENMATDRVDFNMANLASGIYLIRYEDDDHTRIIKVNKQ